MAGTTTVTPPREPSFPETLANLEAQRLALIDLFEVITDLLRLCKERKQLGPDNLVLPGATTIIENLLWIPWISGSATWMIWDLFKAGPPNPNNYSNVPTGAVSTVGNR